MTDKQQTEQAPPAQEFDPKAPLPSVHARLSVDETLEKLGKASRRGRLPGYEPRPDGRSFNLDAFGQPFDHLLVGTIEPDGAGVHIAFASSVKRKLPTIFAIVTLLTIWPGLPITDSLIPGEWGWWPTWWWYLPLAIVPLPFVIPKMWKKSQTAARAEAHTMVGKVAKELDGELVLP